MGLNCVKILPNHPRNLESKQCKYMLTMIIMILLTDWIFMHQVYLAKYSVVRVT